MMTDPIADMLTRIRNAQKARHATVTIPFSKLKWRVAEILLSEGYLAKLDTIEKKEGGPMSLVVTLKYFGKEPAIQMVARESTPGHRKYRQAFELPRVLNDYGIAIISTSRGVMTNKDARKMGIGGEVICSVY